MVYVVLKIYYPTHKTEEVSKIYMDLLRKYPPDESIAEYVVRGASRSTEKGPEGMSIWKLKEGQFDRFKKRIMTTMAMFQNVEGFGYTIDLWATAEEAAAIG